MCGGFIFKLFFLNVNLRRIKQRARLKQLLVPREKKTRAADGVPRLGLLPLSLAFDVTSCP